MEYSEAWGKLIHEKNQKQKISWHCPFKNNSYKCIPACKKKHANDLLFGTGSTPSDKLAYVGPYSWDGILGHQFN